MFQVWKGSGPVYSLKQKNPDCDGGGLLVSGLFRSDVSTYTGSGGGEWAFLRRVLRSVISSI